MFPSLDTAPPLLREHRLYQADWLLRFYGFHAEELLSTDRPNFNIMLDHAYSADPMRSLFL